MKLTKTFLFVLMLLTPICGWADDNTFEDNKGGIYVVTTENTAELYDGSKVQGDYEILETVEINSGKYTVTSIGGYPAFYGNTALTSVTIPNSVTSISYNAFSNCSNLTSIKVKSGNPKYDSRDDCNAIIETSTNTLLIGCRNTIIPNSVTSIGDDAFYDCSGLNSVAIPNSVTSIGDYAFSGCYELTSLTIPNSVTSIGERAFTNCGYTSLTIPNSVTSIGYCAFSGCSDLTSIKVEGGNPNYDSRNDCNAIIEKSSNTLLIGCKNTIIPNGVTSIGDYAFFYCLDLTSLTIPNSVTSIGYFAFRRCDRLTSVIIPNSVTSIGDDAFRFSGLKSVTIPNSVTSIGNNAFSGVKEKVFSYIEKPFKLEQGTFNRYDFVTKAYVPSEATLYIPVGTKAEYENMGWTEQFARIEEYEPSALFNESGATYQAQSENTVVVMSSGVVEAEYVIPETVTHDGVDYTVTAIENEAFKDNTALTAVTIPETVVAIGDGAFAGCTGLTAIYAYAAEPANLATATSRTRAEAASSVFEGVDKNTCVLYVPKGCVEKYRAAEGWGEFTHIVEMEDTGISGLTTNDHKAFDVYDMSGRKVRTAATSLDGLPKGIYIANGKKVILTK